MNKKNTSKKFLSFVYLHFNSFSLTKCGRSMKNRNFFYSVALILILCLFTDEKVFAQACLPATCSPSTTIQSINPCQNVPTLNLGVIPPGFSCVTPLFSRSGYCCNTGGSDRCLHFIFTIGNNVAAVKLEFVCGATPNGSLFGQLTLDPAAPYPTAGCGTPFNVDSLGCITAPGTWHLTFCKPGNNENQYRITTIPKPTPLTDDSVRIGCSDTIIWLGIQNAGIIWRALPTAGFPAADTTLYNSYLTSFVPPGGSPNNHDTVRFQVTPPFSSAPPYVDYAVSGYATAQECIGPQLFQDTVRVYIFSALTTSLANTAKFCPGQGGVNICAGAAGGVPPYTYQWYSPPGTPIVGATSSCYFATAGGTYVVLVNDLLSEPGDCGPADDTVVVSLDSINIIESHTNDSCFGDCNGTITIATTGGTPPYTYNWSDIPGPSNPQNRDTLCAGTYTVTVTDNGGGCVGTFPITITQPPLLSIVFDAIQNVGCNGEATGGINIHPDGGTPGCYTFQWSSGQTTEDINNVVAGTYCVTVTDCNGCTASACTTIAQPGAIVPLISSVLIDTVNNVSCYNAMDDTSCVSVTGGTPPYTFIWTPSGSSDTCVYAQGGGTLICVTVTDSNGCTGNACHLITQPDSLYLLLDSVSQHPCGNISCFGLSDGNIGIQTNGGTPPFCYDWSDLPDTCPTFDEGEDRLGIVAGTYTVTVTDDHGCTASISITLTEPPLLTATLSSPTFGGGYNIPCRGQATGSFTTNPVGGCPPFTYIWSDIGPGPPVRNGLVAGVYCVTVTDNNGCTTSVCDTLTEPDSVVALISILLINPGNPISCFDTCDGSAFANVSGGSPPYTYNWFQPDTFSSIPGTDTVNNVCAGQLILLVSDTNDCFAMDTVIFTQPTELFIDSIVPSWFNGSNVHCFGDCDGSATVYASGGTPPYSYLWSSGPADTLQTVSNLCAITYTVTVTDANGCSKSSSVTLIEPPPLTLSLAPATFPCGANVSCVGACDGSIIASAGGGTAPYTYAWSTACSGDTCSNLCAGPYTVTVTDANNCTISSAVTLTEPPPVVISSLTADTCSNGGWNICCFYDTSGCVHVIAGGGCTPYSYLWSSSPNDTLTDACGLAANSYTITVTDANACSVTGSITINEAPLLIATITAITYDTTNVSCNTACDGVATVFPVGGTPPYSYVWSSSPLDTLQTDSNLCAGTYCVTITDVNGCDTVFCVTLTEPTLLNVTISSSSIACDTACTNTITANPTGGISPYTYLWTSSGQPVQCDTCPSNDSVCVATYTVLVTDLNGCTATASVTLNPAATALTVNITGANYNGWGEPCFGDCLDSLFVTQSGGTPPYVYTWSTACTNDTCINICAGTYTVTVTDINGCSGTATFIVTEPPLLTVVASATPGPCNGDCLGQVSAAPSGGTPPIQYVWSNGCTTATCDSLCLDTYTVTVTDANGCTATSSVTLTEPPLLTATTNVLNNDSCFGDCNGTAIVIPVGGTPGYTYLWCNGQTTQTATGLCAGVCTVTVTDANGCDTTVTVTITEPPLLTVIGVVTPDSCFDLCHGAINITASGGTPGYTYDWNDIPGTSDPEDRDTLCDGVYTVTVTDVNDCTVSQSFTITEPPLLTISGIVTDLLCFQQCIGEINITVSGGTIPYAFLWSNGSTTEDQDSLCAGTYTVTVTDAMNCTATMSFTITEPPLLVATDTVSLLNPPYNTSCPDACDAWALITASGGTPPYSYQWASPLSDTTAFVDSLCGSFLGTAYFYTVTDANGCTFSDSILVVDPYQPIAVISTADTNICGNSLLLIANVPLPIYAGHWEIASGCGRFTPDSLSPVVFVDSMCWGTNCFVWVVGDTACTAYDTVCIQATAPVFANAGSYPPICEEDEPINLHADTGYVGVGTWSALGADSTHPSPVIFGNVNDPNTFAWNFGWSNNYLVWTVVDGPCSDADTIFITKQIPEVCDSCLEMPTAFSPNQDAMNDNFIIRCIEYSYNRQNKLIIFNRWGNEVYSKNDYLNEWYGQNKDGGLLPDGTYFAILTITNPGPNEGKVLKGYVDMRR